MNHHVLKANALLLVACLAWGTTFVAQRVGMDFMGPFLYTGMRFSIGALCLAPWAWYGHKKRRRTLSAGKNPAERPPWWGILLAGGLLCAGINLQQIGLIYTTAGKAAFITGLYVVIVPLLGLFGAQKPEGPGLWIAVPMAAIGLYLLSVTEAFRLSPGDGWVLACAFAWAGQILFLGWLSPKMNSFVLAFGQSFICAVLSLSIALIVEEVRLSVLLSGLVPVLYGGIVSVGIGFTFQVIAQKDAPPAHAAIIFQFEAVVAAVSGWFILGETMGLRALAGAVLMFASMLVAQLWGAKHPCHPLGTDHKNTRLSQHPA